MNSEEKESLRTQWQRRGCRCGENKKRSGWGGAALEDDPNLNIQQQVTDLSPTKKKKKSILSKLP